jgi:tetratricopeptide (TPR) repeat protein
VRVFRELGDEHSALLVSRSLAGIYYRGGDRHLARALYEDNLRRASATSNERLEASALGELAMYALEEGRLEEADTMLRASLRIHSGLGDLLDAAVDLCRFAAVLAREGKAVTATRLLSSLEALGDDIGTRRSFVSELSEETLTTIRTRLDEAAFAEAWQQGSTLTIGEALTLALAS